MVMPRRFPAPWSKPATKVSGRASYVRYHVKENGEQYTQRLHHAQHGNAAAYHANRSAIRFQRSPHLLPVQIDDTPDPTYDHYQAQKTNHPSEDNSTCHMKALPLPNEIIRERANGQQAPGSGHDKPSSLPCALVQARDEILPLARLSYLSLLDFRDRYFVRSGLLDHSGGFDYRSDRLFHFPRNFLHWRGFWLGLCNCRLRRFRSL